MATTVIASQATINGRSYTRTESRTDDGVVEKTVPSVAAAKSGTLTTRTDNNTGTLTMSTGHGITTGARLDLYWSGGQRRGMTVGTVATNSVPIDLGAGDNLPIATTAIIAAVPREEVFGLDGDTAVVIGAYAGARGQVVFAESDNTESYAAIFDAAGGWWWDENGDSTNPLASADVAKVFLSHADTTSTREMRAAAIFP